MIRKTLNFKWHAVYRSIKANLSLGIIWAVTMLAILIAFPKIDFKVGENRVKFDGIDFTDLARAGDKNIPREFQLRPTLDFYGGTEYVYVPAGTEGSRVSRGTAVSLVKDLHQRFNNVGISDYNLYLRENQSSTEIVAQLPYREEELTNFHTFLALDGDFEFVVSVPQQEGEESAAPQTRTLDIKRQDIQSINLNYSSETSGNGLVIRFKNDNYTKALISMWSDVNTDVNARAILQVDGQPVAGQTIPIYSNDPGRNLYMTTGLVNDRLATKLLKDILVDRTIGTGVEVRSASELPGRYDRYLDGVRWGLFTTIITIIALIIAFKKAAGVVAGINLLFITSVSVAIFKVMQLPIGLPSLLGFALALVLWIISLRRLLPLEKERMKLKTAASTRLIRNYLLLSTGFLIAIETLGIPSLRIFSMYFALTVFVMWVSYLYVLPVTINLLRFSDGK